MIFGDITSSATGENAVAIGAGATANVANSVAIGAGSVAQAAIGTSSTTIAGQTYSFAGSTPIGTVSVGQAGAERTITSVAAGQVSAASTDAVNGSQLHATNQAVEALDNKAVKYDQNPDGTRSNTITLQGGDPSQPVVITNVAAGVNATDAVNVAQLNEILNGSPGQSYSYVDNRIAIAFEDVKNYTEQKIAALYGDIDDIRDDARSAAAIGLAAASLRYDDNPGKLSVAVGGGFWRGQSAFAVGAGYTNDDATVRANLSGTAAGGRVGVGAGLSFTLN
jgi:hyaluronate-binding autotransporter adhesin